MLPLDDFYRHPQMADGHLNKCKDCTRLDARKRSRTSADRRREYERMRARSPRRVAETSTRTQQWRKDNPLKYAAACAANNAIRDGRLKRQPCIACGREDSHAHHTDYTKPLEVMWLCPTHHAEWHKNHGEGYVPKEP